MQVVEECKRQTNDVGTEALSQARRPIRPRGGGGGGEIDLIKQYGYQAGERPTRDARLYVL